MNKENHGMSKTAEYNIWLLMRCRCYKKYSSSYKYYGAKGIGVCEDWNNSFLSFYKDMGRKPKGMSLDRVDPSGDYSPDNCRWSNNTTQSRNQATRKDNKLGVKGVCFKGGKYVSYIHINRKQITLGRFDDLEQAIKSRKEGEEKYFKELV
jgi:hypothetical protein|tara:strand:+ start:153 stop:605 length:453 start_codon:yes stop_codon:yes gene_type:complete